MNTYAAAYNERLREFGYVPASERVKNMFKRTGKTAARAYNATVSAYKYTAPKIKTAYTYLKPKIQAAYAYAAPKVKKAWQEEIAPALKEEWEKAKPQLRELVHEGRKAISNAYSSTKENIEAYAQTRAQTKAEKAETRKLVELMAVNGIAGYAGSDIFMNNVATSVKDGRTEIVPAQEAYSRLKYENFGRRPMEIRKVDYSALEESLAQPEVLPAVQSAEPVKESKLEEQLNFFDKLENPNPVKNIEYFSHIPKKPKVESKYPSYEETLKEIQEAPEQSAHWLATKTIAENIFRETGNHDANYNWSQAQEKIAKAYQSYISKIKEMK